MLKSASAETIAIYDKKMRMDKEIISVSKECSTLL